jgi:delta-aminolevulinic acid dehydratase/porphobilinogen synthase
MATTSNQMIDGQEECKSDKKRIFHVKLMVYTALLWAEYYGPNKLSAESAN